METELTTNWNYTIAPDRLPLILVGPMLRRTESDRVTVWLALKSSQQVTLRVYPTEEKGAEVQRDRVLLAGTGTTLQLGNHLHILAVTATPVNNSYLESDRLYAYDLSFNDSDLTLTQALNADAYPFATVSYFPHQLPTFALPPSSLSNFQLVHTSCNKPHGGGQEVFFLLDNLLAETAANPQARPHQLFLTGDQIYGDDVADPLLWAVQGIARSLLGWEETLWLGNERKKPSNIPPGERTHIAETYAGLTAMLPKKPQNAKSHLFAWGEYLAMYLLIWSPILWPRTFPSGESMGRKGKRARDWMGEAKSSLLFASTQDEIRRILANIPTYTICDDHDISDDWYLNREWCDRVLSKPLGRQTVQNGLLAYALFQAWGNTPEQFDPGTNGEQLLKATERWSQSQCTDRAAWQEIQHFLGIPDLDSQTGKPKYRADGDDTLILDRSDPEGIRVAARALQWHYTVRSPIHEVIVTDTRTWRGYPANDVTYAPPMLLSPTAFEQQLHQPLQEGNLAEIQATFIVLPTNMVSLGAIDFMHEWELKKGNTFGNDVGDSWNIHAGAFIRLLETITEKRDRAIILSGDIHYSCAVRLTYWSHSRQTNGTHQPLQAAIIAQLTSSATRNAEWKTYAIHTKIKCLFPERTKYWLGWSDPPQQVELPRRKALKQLHSPEPPFGDAPDWLYRTEWIKRQPSQLLPWSQHRSDLEAKAGFWRKLFDRIFAWLWRNRWFQEGPEVVGRSNFSIVFFEGSPQQRQQTVVQETYWCPPWKPNYLVKSRYDVRMEFEEPGGTVK
ncbi:PhoD-like phosphatase [Oscillatoria sp. FACHB-1406]|uniref:PhoD-like phosphatase n=1 Tax=Oscillatoria sp. FACHB-1406 TaxID=2692846 RepID=UPI001683D671|nr:PhoD-like phosphatase [Oscillatoria sp. FACHB-1406]MBD2577745.1 PhoD-like phosphatase [Oscillatoria sp. FACHB-1406]